MAARIDDPALDVDGRLGARAAERRPARRAGHARMGPAADPEEAAEAGRARHGAHLRRAHERHELRRVRAARRAGDRTSAGRWRWCADGDLDRARRAGAAARAAGRRRRARARAAPRGSRRRRATSAATARCTSSTSRQADQGCDFDFLAGRRPRPSRRFTEGGLALRTRIYPSRRARPTFAGPAASPFRKSTAAITHTTELRTSPLCSNDLREFLNLMCLFRTVAIDSLDCACPASSLLLLYWDAGAPSAINVAAGYTSMTPKPSKLDDQTSGIGVPNFLRRSSNIWRAACAVRAIRSAPTESGSIRNLS